jgi:hypothetical protein
MGSLALLFGLAASATALPRLPHVAQCTDFKVDIPINNVTTLVSELFPIQNEYQATSYANLLTTRGAPPLDIKTTTVSRSFNIVGKWCTPTSPGPKASTLQILNSWYRVQPVVLGLLPPG